MNLADDVEQIFSSLTLPPVVVRILCDALSGLDEVAVVPVAIEHDPLTVRQSIESVFRNLFSDDEVPVTRVFNHSAFQLDEAVE